MNVDELKRGIDKLDELSNLDYRASLEQILNASATNEEKFVQLGRLIGVALKEPFAYAVPRGEASNRTKAWRDWQLDDNKFAAPGIENSWQYRTLDALRADPEVVQFARVTDFPTVAALATHAYHEFGFFNFLAASLKKYICGDAKIREEIQKSLTEGKKGGLDVGKVTPETLVQSGGVALASYLVLHVPVLGFVGAPVIAGIVLVIYKIGVDAFCQWADNGSRAFVKTD